jgi:putative colanic acid biosynthesis acetyltransferase WcaF
MNEFSTDIHLHKNAPDFRNKLARFVWNISWFFLARPIPRRMLNGWKIFLLRSFGAKVHRSAVVYSNARIYMPWNLEMGEFAILGAEVDCYNVDRIKIGANAMISQKAYLCTASHSITESDMPLITSPITIGEQTWIAADSFIGMGVTVGQGAVVGARSSVYKDVEPWTVVGGNPARFIKYRQIISTGV